MRHQCPNVRQSFRLIRTAVVGHATDFVVCLGPSKGLVVNGFPDGRLHQITPGQKNGACAFHNDAFVAHDGQIRTAGDTTSHDGSDLWDAFRGETGVVSEHATKVLFVGKDLVLHGEVDPCAVHQVNDGHPIFQRNFLRAQVLFAGDGEPCTSLDSGVVGDHETKGAMDASHLNHHPSGGTSTMLLVHPMTRQCPQFNAFCPWIKQPVQTLSCSPLSLRVLFVSAGGAATETHF